MEALVVYVALGVAVVIAVAHLWRSRILARRGEGARGFSISSHTLLTDEGWKVFVSVRNIADAPLDIRYLVSAHQDTHAFDLNPRDPKSHRLNPGVRVVDEWDSSAVPAAADIDRVSVYSPRRDRSRRLISRTDFPA